MTRPKPKRGMKITTVSLPADLLAEIKHRAWSEHRGNVSLQIERTMYVAYRTTGWKPKEAK